MSAHLKMDQTPLIDSAGNHTAIFPQPFLVPGIFGNGGNYGQIPVPFTSWLFKEYLTKSYWSPETSPKTIMLWVNPRANGGQTGNIYNRSFFATDSGIFIDGLIGFAHKNHGGQDKI